MAFTRYEAQYITVENLQKLILDNKWITMYEIEWRKFLFIAKYQKSHVLFVPCLEMRT